ncbi:uncharacterized protein LOC135212862 [Macrobrachium nipponense]|uniref:uncharacterized protein LOC135212862 n=1 Tax=Macrobrachium nipponense TaxID=159736 RepID=UPI0030C8635C
MKKSSEFILQLAVMLLTNKSIAFLLRYTEGKQNYHYQNVSDTISHILGSTPTPDNCAILMVADNGVTSPHLKELSGSVVGGSGTAIFGLDPFDPYSNSTRDSFAEAVSHMKQLRQTSPCVVLLTVSEDPRFLAELSRCVDRDRLLLWETKVLAVTKLPLHDLRDFLESSWVFSMTNAMVLNFDDKADGSRGGVYSYLPYGRSGRGQMVRVGSWSQEDGLTVVSNFQLYPEKYLKSSSW